MGLDINLYKVLTKSEVTKLKNKYDVTDLVYSEKDNCEELDKIYFIEIEALINCDTNIETLNNFKHCLIEKEMTYYNVQAMILKNNVKTKYFDLSNYYISGLLPSENWEIDGNFWSKSKYTEAEAKHLAETLKNCRNCINCSWCYNCVDCISCFNCENCESCMSCIICESCVSCIDCTHCDNCKGCENCQRCIKCNKCYKCYKCENCKSCFFCEHCKSCDMCDNCENRENWKLSHMQGGTND